jgi:hypothetical protein
MAIRIQIRRDITTNWTTNNPILLPGEIGLETDTLKFKIGNGSRWNDTISYAFKAGEANGLATLGPTGKIPTSQLPDSISMDAELTAALSALTTSVISEGSNKYFTNQRAVDAVSSAISSAIEIEVTNRNTAISNAKSEVITTASNDATNKASAAQSAAIAAASSAADIKDTISAASAVTTANTYTDNKITIEISNRNNAINNAISNEITNRNIAIANATPPSFSLIGHTTNELSEGSTNLYFTNARSLAATASAYDAAGAASNAQAAAATDATSKANSAQSAAISAAATDATSKANAAQSAATTAAATDATTKADAARVAAISAAATDATTKANAAISAAATDATTKANAAISTAATDATTKANAALVSANTYTDSLSTSLNNTLGDYVLENDRNQASGFAGLNSSGKLLDSVIPASVNAYADAKVAAIVNSAPATLDTLGELAAALQADEAASTTLTTLVGTKASIASPTFTGTVSGITKAMVGLGNVDNTADSLKPISTATQTALDSKLASSTAASIYAPIASPTFTGTVSGITKSMVGLGNIDNTSDTAKPISTAMQTALDSKLNRTVSTNPQSGSYQIVVGDAFKLIEMNGGGTLTILDSASFANGTTIEVLQTSDSQVLIAGSGFTPDSTPGLKLRAKWSSATLLKRGTNSWVVMGDLSA